MLKTWNSLLEFDWIMIPLQFIFSTMTERIKTLANKKTALNENITFINNDSNSNNDQLKTWFTIPYVSPLSEKFRTVIKVITVIVVYSYK